MKKLRYYKLTYIDRDDNDFQEKIIEAKNLRQAKLIAKIALYKLCDNNTFKIKASPIK